MMSSESCRSSSLSTSTTRAGRSWSPQGVRTPNEWAIHLCWSASPLFSATCPCASYTQCRGNALAPVSSTELLPSGRTRQREGGPHEGRLPAEVRRMRHRPRQRHPGPPANGLDEPHRAVAVHRVLADHRQRGRPEGGTDLADPDGRRPHHQAAAVVQPSVPDLVALDLGPDREQVGEAELVLTAQLVDLFCPTDVVGQRRVPVGQPQVHPGLERSLQGVRRDPRHRHHGRLYAHINLRVSARHETARS